MMYLSPVSDQRGSQANLSLKLSNRSSRERQKHALWPFIDKPKFAQQTNQTTILELASELTLEPVGATIIDRKVRTQFLLDDLNPYTWTSSIS